MKTGRPLDIDIYKEAKTAHQKKNLHDAATQQAKMSLSCKLELFSIMYKKY